MSVQPDQAQYYCWLATWIFYLDIPLIDDGQFQIGKVDNSKLKKISWVKIK